MFVFELFIDGIFPCLCVRIVGLHERKYSFMFLLLRLVLLVFIDGFLHLFLILFVVCLLSTLLVLTLTSVAVMSPRSFCGDEDYLRIGLSS